MTSTADTLPDSAPLPRDLLTRVRDRRRAADAAEGEIMELALAWAYANPALPGQEAWQPGEPPSWLEPGAEREIEVEDLEWGGLPRTAVGRARCVRGR